MIPDGTHTAVVDNIEDGIARLEVTITADDNEADKEESEAETYDQLLLDPDDLPADAQHPGAVLTITVVDTDVTEIQYEPEETASRRESARSRFERLSRRPPAEEESATDSPADEE